jgi:hypothetical protein
MKILNPSMADFAAVENLASIDRLRGFPLHSGLSP